MAVKLGKIASTPNHDSVEVQTETGIEKINFTYVGYSPAISREAEEAANAAVDAGEATNTTVETLLRILTHIDLLDDDDKPIVINKANLMRVPFYILNAIITKVLEAANPKKSN
jgi:hypothetical protein